MSEPNGLRRFAPNWPGLVLGALLASPPAAVAGHAGGVPIELLDWIKNNGASGFLLVSLFLVAGFAVWLLRERLESEREVRVKQEQLLREQVDVMKLVTQTCDRGVEAQNRTAHALDRNTRAFEALHLEADD